MGTKLFSTFVTVTGEKMVAKSMNSSKKGLTILAMGR